jgi:hypothetical protein
MHLGAVVWPLEPDGDGFDYYSIVSMVDETARILVYLRHRDGVYERRTYDADGDDSWVSFE